jgi:hypothetical protein
MSVHGEQYILPLFLEKSSNRPIFQGDEDKINDEICLAFYLLTRGLGDNQKVLSFARLVWPFLAIQGVSKPESTHIFLDGINILSKKDKFTNPPRKPLIGHVIRNIDNRSEIEQLKKILEILKYQDKDAKEIGEGENAEFQEFQIKNLVNPEFLDSLKQLIIHLKYKPIKNYGQLDTGLSTEKALDISEEYRATIDKVKGNALRWKEEIELISDEIDKMLKNLNLQIKDANLRYDSEISKLSSSIDEEEVIEKINSKRDELTQYKRKEKKNLIDNIAVLFKNVDSDIETIFKKNKFFSNEEMLKRKAFDDLIPNLKDHIDFLRVQGKYFLTSLDSIEEKIQMIINKAEDINREAENRLEQYKNEVNQQLRERDQQIAAIKQENQAEIEKLENLKNTIEELFSEIKQTINTKHQDCLNEAQKLIEWSLKDTDLEAIKMPIQWIYMPFYAMFVEDKDSLEEKMVLVLPGYINRNSDEMYEELSKVFSEVKRAINERIEDDMAIRSNFEFSVENNNYLNDDKFKEKLKKGLELLKNQNIINYNIENKINYRINKIQLE